MRPRSSARCRGSSPRSPQRATIDVPRRGDDRSGRRADHYSMNRFSIDKTFETLARGGRALPLARGGVLARGGNRGQRRVPLPRERGQQRQQRVPARERAQHEGRGGSEGQRRARDPGSRGLLRRPGGAAQGARECGRQRHRKRQDDRRLAREHVHDRGRAGRASAPPRRPDRDRGRQPGELESVGQAGAAVLVPVHHRAAAARVPGAARGHRHPPAERPRAADLAAGDRRATSPARLPPRTTSARPPTTTCG